MYAAPQGQTNNKNSGEMMVAAETPISISIIESRLTLCRKISRRRMTRRESTRAG